MKIIGDGGHASVIREFAPWWKRGYVAAIGDNRKRHAAVQGLGKWKFPVLIHPSAIVSRTARIGRGTVIMAGAIVGPDVRVGAFCIINHGASVDHGTCLCDFVHVAPGAHICGSCYIGEGALIGVGVSIVPGTEIARWKVCKAAKLDIAEAV